MHFEFATFFAKCKPRFVHFSLLLLGVIEKKKAISPKSKKNRIASGIIITLSLMLIGVWLLPSFWFWVCWEILAALLVARGCTAEWYLLRFPASPGMKAVHRANELRAIALVSIGVTMEVFGVSHTIKEAVKMEAKIWGLERTNAQTSLKAAEANKLAGEANERASLTESNNLVMQKQLLALKQWRTITPGQKRSFIELTKNIFKFPIRVRYAQGSAEVAGFAYKIRDMLDSAGFSETNEDQAIGPWPPEMNLLWTGGEPQIPSVMLLNNLSTTGNIVDLRDAWASFKSLPGYSPTSDVPTMILLTNTDEAQKAFVSTVDGKPTVVVPAPSAGGFKFVAFTIVKDVFSNIGIAAGSMAMTNLPNGVCEVFVNPK